MKFYAEYMPMVHAIVNVYWNVKKSEINAYKKSIMTLRIAERVYLLFFQPVVRIPELMFRYDWASKWDFGIYSNLEQQRLRWADFPVPYPVASILGNPGVMHSESLLTPKPCAMETPWYATVLGW